ncbi:hypothetical protein DPU24_24155 [Salmonella enterica subsp. enterica serovar Oranienburg]|nr:hypothetical protein [Salmonella enterica subsp. enterica serovar Oranienburg]HAK8205129.1 ANR family transcriptional regulator [Salmonella enterica]
MSSKFIDMALQAAIKEQQREYKEAGELWKKAVFLTKRHLNADYCRCRADFCLNSIFTRIKS